MLGFILRRPLSVPLAVGGAAVGLQLPEAHNQYTQYLQGRVDEAARAAEQAQAKLESDMAVYEASSVDQLKDILANEVGRAARVAEDGVNFSERLIERSEWLKQAIQQLGEGLPVLRFGNMFRNLDREMLAGAAKNFEPGIPFSTNAVTMGEIAAVAVVGLLLFYVFGRLLEKGTGVLLGRGKVKKQPNNQPPETSTLLDEGPDSDEVVVFEKNIEPYGDAAADVGRLEPKA